MDEKLARQLLRQLKILKFWLTLFGTIIIAGLAILGYFVFKVIMFTRSVEQQVTSLKSSTIEKLDVKQQACDSQSLGSFLNKNTSVCKPDAAP